jgi:hypothetical protein
MHYLAWLGHPLQRLGLTVRSAQTVGRGDKGGDGVFEQGGVHDYAADVGQQFPVFQHYVDLHLVRW